MPLRSAAWQRVCFYHDRGFPVTKELNERARLLLKTLVESYIRDGQPVGSRKLGEGAGLDVSSATVRSVMADLEKFGFVNSPHSSAGRVPTVKGYRMFVDTLINVRKLTDNDLMRLKGQFDADAGVQDLLGAASSMLSDLTNMAGIVTIPWRERLVLRHLEFLPLSGHRVLVIIVVNGEEVQNRIIHTERTYSPAELTQASNYLNEQFAGQCLLTVREQLLGTMRETKESLSTMMQAAVEVADKALHMGTSTEKFVMSGETNLMNFSQLSDVDKLRQLFDAFQQQRSMLHLLDQSLDADGVQIFIGEESGYDALEQCSLVSAPYEADGGTIGVLAVIGPTRMAYDRVIPIVDITAKLLGAALNQSH
ncbi:MAG: heat-inducible transcriptional repressor HrcA [Gammaproteobacteria bacterium]|nr:heat-inducible transcriptional repressor HrcA [Gammaproteobacteria bacterium]